MLCTVKNIRHKSNAGKLCPPSNIGVNAGSDGGGGFYGSFGEDKNNIYENRIPNVALNIEQSVR